MTADEQKELKDLREEVRELRRERSIVLGQLTLAKRLTGFATYLWLGPDLVRSVQNWMKARTTGSTFPEVEQLMSLLLL